MAHTGMFYPLSEAEMDQMVMMVSLGTKVSNEAR